MRDKAEKRRNDYLKARKKERIFSAKSHDKDESKRGFFGKLIKGKIPFRHDPNVYENENYMKGEKQYKKSDRIKVEDMDYQIDELYKNLMEDFDKMSEVDW